MVFRLLGPGPEARGGGWLYKGIRGCAANLGNDYHHFWYCFGLQI